MTEQTDAAEVARPKPIGGVTVAEAIKGIQRSAEQMRAKMPSAHDLVRKGAEMAEMETLAEMLWQADRDASATGQGFGKTYAEDSCRFAAVEGAFARAQTTTSRGDRPFWAKVILDAARAAAAAAGGGA